jgi:hypothetical protein
MPFVILFALFAGVGFAIIELPGFEQKVTHAIEDINGSMVKGVTGPIIQAWMIVAGLTAGLGFVIWIAENKASQKMGTGSVAPPPLAAIAVPAAPSFGSASGFRAGPFQSSVSAGQGQAAPQFVGPSQPVIGPALRDSQQRSDRQAQMRRQRADQQASARRQQQERQAQRDTQRRQQQAQQQQAQQQARESRRRYDLERADRLVGAAPPRGGGGGGTVRSNRPQRRP